MTRLRIFASQSRFVNWRFRVAVFLGAIALTSLGGTVLQSYAQQSIPARINRWLSIRDVAGNVNYLKGNDTRPAKVGDRLQQVGEGINTGRDATATLEVDTGIGFIDVAEQTNLRVQTLEYAPDNGRITHLYVSQGQARLRVRTFTHRGSELEIRTPAGVSGVRGTDFGINVHTDGRMAIATLEGRVETTAEGAAVDVPGGFQNFTIPGEPPAPAVPLRNDTSLNYRIRRQFSGSQRRLLLVGEVDPVNIVLIENEPQPLNRDGRFTVELPARTRVNLAVTVITPLGREETHEILVRP